MNPLRRAIGARLYRKIIRRNYRTWGNPWPTFRSRRLAIRYVDRLRTAVDAEVVNQMELSAFIDETDLVAPPSPRLQGDHADDHRALLVLKGASQ